MKCPKGYHPIVSLLPQRPPQDTPRLICIADNGLGIKHIASGQWRAPRYASDARTTGAEGKNMRGITKRETVVATRVRSRMGLLLGTVALFWSAQLLGKDESLAAGKRDEREEAPRHVLVVSIPDRKLAVTEEGRVLKVYSVAVGAAVSPSPTGTMKIVNKVVGPTYFHQGKVVPPGKSNPLGDRWMGLNQKGYGIHGTNVPSSIGKAASHGCIRMGKHDVEELFDLARVGDVVEIHGEP